MRVLHVITGLGIGGAEQQLRLLLRRLPVRNEVVTLTNPGPVAEGIRADGTRVTHLGMNGNLDLVVLPRLVSLIRRGDFDVVHTHLYRACVYGRVAARLAGVRAVVATEHSLGVTQIEGRPLTLATRALYRATERLGRGTLAVSPTVGERLRAWGVPADRVHLAPNGIDAAAFAYDPPARAAARARLGLSEGEFTVGGVGRLVPGKHFDRLVRAVAALPGVRLLLVGSGPEEIRLLRLAWELGAADRVHIVGGDPDVPHLLSAMDLFVSPSPEECFGVAVLEALAAGLPVRYVACPAVEDLPADRAPGALRTDGGADGLTAALRAELALGQRRLAVPPAVAHYDIARTAEQVLALYASVTAPPEPDADQGAGQGGDQGGDTDRDGSTDRSTGRGRSRGWNRTPAPRPAPAPAPSADSPAPAHTPAATSPAASASASAEK